MEKKKFDPTTVEPEIYGDMVRLTCLCGCISTYKSNQKKRIADWLVDHRKECTKEYLIERLSREIEREEREIRKKRKIIADLENPGTKNLVVKDFDLGRSIQTALKPMGIHVALSPVMKEPCRIIIDEKELAGKESSVHNAIKAVVDFKKAMKGG